MTFVSFRDFKRALNIRCNKVFGLSYSDLPDVINLHDFWYEGIDEKEAVLMIDGIIEDLSAELDIKPPYTPVDDLQAPVYSIDE